jgi:hypothetical protein
MPKTKTQRSPAAKKKATALREVLVGLATEIDALHGRVKELEAERQKP